MLKNSLNTIPEMIAVTRAASLPSVNPLSKSQTNRNLALCSTNSETAVVGALPVPICIDLNMFSIPVRKIQHKTSISALLTPLSPIKRFAIPFRIAKTGIAMQRKRTR